MSAIAVLALAVVLALLARNARLLILSRRAEDRASEWMTRAIVAERALDQERRALDRARRTSDGLRRMLLAEISLHARPTDEQLHEFTHADVRPLVDRDQ